jgi:2,3-bisphosphoglycerate-dependent phosphoglycerate mutase
LPAGGTSVLLVRHGESAAVVDGVAPPSHDGQDDPPLADEGHAQAARLADRLAGERIDAIYVSPLQRTQQTARPLAALRGLEPVVVPDLREVFLGDWEGGWFRRHVADRHEVALRMYATHRWDVIPNAEPDDAFGRRVDAALAGLVSAHPDGRIVVVAHAGVIAKAVAIAAASERTFALLPDNASISELAYGEGRCVLRRFNDTAHLDGT